MKAEIISPNPDREYLADERCYILESWNSPEDSLVSIAKARVEPGVATANHALHKVEERYVILSGTGSVTLGEQAPARVSAGDVVLIPAGTPQSINNTGKDDLIFYAICTPRFTPGCYLNLED